MIGFIVCLISTVAAVFVQVADYKKRLSAYHTTVQEHQEEIRTWDLYSQINPEAHRKSNPLSINLLVGASVFGWVFLRIDRVFLRISADFLSIASAIAQNKMMSTSH